MKTLKINLAEDYSSKINDIIKVLKKGGVIIYPTDTVYGLGVNAINEKAVEKLFKTKERHATKPLPIIAKNMKWVKELAYVHPKLEDKLPKIWELGPVTIILPKKELVPDIVTSKQPNIAIRIPSFDFTDKLLGKFGYPLVATSANISGLKESGKIDRVKKMFWMYRTWKPDLIIDAGDLPELKPSTILDLTTIMPKILRKGAIDEKKIWEILGIKN
ncbi:MAG: threonylcarbamoyl-AMP synthase [Candidatus Yanofskybacteria bacterium CG10_big_fil_rev_8_21_14_0_10_36_16]|uniref:L-threonylcarbamoyladenylate synthase n=1 Tax=Candidatus Yanofskybacteria bacterium CG10_big_fil_rev_8_21_14_0_10_36_16 TaxID=1975096 RepID=A0A2J0Q6R6_9BACT|nr:MAG: threonylcarbamoyl-AMP synthase [Candidatus Yanofskybacteria bacterium CG10_big_fil_rev_8_21_14_0_10_36_16]